MGNYGNMMDIYGKHMENIWEHDDNPLDSEPPISDTAMFLPCLMWTFQI